MKAFKMDNRKSISIIIGVLLISLTLNIYTSFVNKGYSIKAGREHYRNIENIRHKNELNLFIIDGGIKSKSIDNEELLTLYKNNISICDSIAILGADYIEDTNGKKVATETNNKVNPLDVVGRVVNVLDGYLQVQMKNHQDEVILQDQALRDFTTIRDLSKDINNYFVNFNEKELKDVKEEDREETIIEGEYWKTIYNDLTKILVPYADYNFVIPV